MAGDINSPCVIARAASEQRCREPMRCCSTETSESPTMSDSRCGEPMSSCDPDWELLLSSSVVMLLLLLQMLP